MFIWPTDGVIASMISTQTKMTDSEYSPQLFTHCLAFIGLHPTKSIPLKINANQTFLFSLFVFTSKIPVQMKLISLGGSNNSAAAVIALLR